MFFFGKNLTSGQKLTLLAALGILANGYLLSKLQIPFVQFLDQQSFKFNLTHIVLSYGIFVKMLVIAFFFRKF